LPPQHGGPPYRVRPSSGALQQRCDPTHSVARLREGPRRNRRKQQSWRSAWRPDHSGSSCLNLEPTGRCGLPGTVYELRLSICTESDAPSNTLTAMLRFRWDFSAFRAGGGHRSPARARPR